jgi:YVTN family beta-propeller protein
MRRQPIVLLVVACMCATAVKAFAPAQYQVKQKYVLGGEGGWDYLTFDAAGKRLFISRGTHVMVVDPYKGTVLGDIPDTPGVHGIALAHELGKGFISNGRDDSVTVFDLKTLKETARVKIEGKNPDAILYDPATQHVFTFNGRSKDATVIDGATASVVGTIPLDGKPEFGVSEGKGMV